MAAGEPLALPDSDHDGAKDLHEIGRFERQFTGSPEDIRLLAARGAGGIYRAGRRCIPFLVAGAPMYLGICPCRRFPRASRRLPMPPSATFTTIGGCTRRASVRKEVIHFDRMFWYIKRSGSRRGLACKSEDRGRAAG